MKKTNILHIAVIIIGIIFILIPAFHSGIWFDESYSVAIAKHGFIDIWNITGHDVHPALYYWGLHLVYLIFGNCILSFRLFSVLAIIILGILGYTHIRKDFGEKTGILFSFLTYFLPIMCTYASEIRMYSWSCLLVTLMCIYGYRFYNMVKENNEFKIKNLILFGIFSICCCYIHYYALVTAGLINFMILVFLIVNIIKKNKKQETNAIAKKSLIYFLVLALIQIILYIPWLVFMMGQVNHVRSGFWIIVGALNTTVEVLSFQFRRQLDTNFTMDFNTILALVVSLIMYIYLLFRIYKAKKEKQEIKPAILSLIGYTGVIGIIWFVSKVMTPILYSRYLLVMTGLYIFTFSYLMGSEKRKYITYIVCMIVLILGIKSNVENVKINYSSTNLEPIDYISEEIRQDDIIVYSNIGNGGVIAAYFPENKQYFLNFDHWDVVDAYKAYGPGMETVESYNFLKEYKGRIWLIDSENMGLYDNFPKDEIKIIKDKKRFDVRYHDYIYNVMLLKKEI